MKESTETLGKGVEQRRHKTCISASFLGCGCCHPGATGNNTLHTRPLPPSRMGQVLWSHQRCYHFPCKQWGPSPGSSRIVLRLNKGGVCRHAWPTGAPVPALLVLQYAVQGQALKGRSNQASFCLQWSSNRHYVPSTWYVLSKYLSRDWTFTSLRSLKAETMGPLQHPV